MAKNSKKIKCTKNNTLQTPVGIRLYSLIEIPEIPLLLRPKIGNMNNSSTHQRCSHLEKFITEQS